MSIVIIYGASGTDKSRRAPQFQEYFKCKRLVDGWDGHTKLRDGDLAITNASPPFRAHAHAKCYDASTAKALAIDARPISAYNHPPHYNQNPSGIECIEVVRHLNFNVGNAIKYLWRAGHKKPDGVAGVELHGELSQAQLKEIEDLKKAAWYIADEINRLGGTS
jgi:hypothetical protein